MIRNLRIWLVCNPLRVIVCPVGHSTVRFVVFVRLRNVSKPLNPSKRSGNGKIVNILKRKQGNFKRERQGKEGEGEGRCLSLPLPLCLSPFPSFFHLFPPFPLSSPFPPLSYPLSHLNYFIFPDFWL